MARAWRSNDDSVDFRLVKLASDSFGLSSFLKDRTVQKVYRFVVFATVIFGHISLVKSGSFQFDIDSLHGIRFWCLFASSTVVLSLQFIREGDIRECHRRCGQLPSAHAFRKLLIHFGVSLSSIFVSQAFYRVTLIHSFFYVLVLFFIVQIPSIQFGYQMASVRKAIRCVNEELEDFLGEGDRQELSKRDISRIHKECFTLTDLADYLVSTYSYQLLLMLAQCSLEIIFVLQITFSDILMGKHMIEKNLDFALRTFFFLSFLYKLCAVITPGQNYLEECKRTDELLCKIKNAYNGELPEVREFIVQRTLDPPQLSVLGLFQLDYRLLYVIGCGVINYGLIMGMFQLGRVQSHAELH